MKTFRDLLSFKRAPTPEGRPFFFAKRTSPKALVYRCEPTQEERATLKTCAVIVVKYTETKIRMPVKPDFEMICDLEELLEDQLKMGGGFACGHVHQDGRTTILGYTNGEIPKSITVKTSLFSSKTFPVETRYDPEWTVFDSHLFITPLERHAWNSKMTLEKLANNGNNPEVARSVSFSSTFTSRQNCDQFIELIVAKGFSCDPDELDASNLSVFQVKYELWTPVQLDVISSICNELQEMSESCGGEFDGWQAPIARQ